MGKEKKNKKEDTPNKGHKHLFGSSEKSDFILNMTQEGAEKMCGVFLIVTMLLVSALVVPAYYTQSVVTYTIEGTPHMLSDSFVFYGAAAVMLMGFFGFLVFMIACSKGIARVKGNKELCAALVVMVMSAVSALASSSISTGLLGYLGRHEGLLTICAVYGLFGVALCVNKDSFKTAVFDFMTGVGVFEAIAGILQCIPATSGAMKNFYDYLYYRAGSIPEKDWEVYHEGGYALTSGIYTHTPAASGFTTEPFALAQLLTVCFGAALAGAAFGNGKKRRVLYSAGAVIMAAGACLTRTTPGIVGIAAAAAVVTVFILMGVGKDKSAFAGLVPVVLSAVCCAVLFGAGVTDIRDEQIIFTDGYVHKSISYDRRYFANTGEGIFTYLQKDALNVITQKPILGIGPDNGPYAFERYSLTTDRFYNEYGDHAATRGVIAEAANAVFMIFCLLKLIKGMRAMKKGDSWAPAAGAAVLIAWLIQAWFNTSWFCAEYLVFIAIGLGCDMNLGTDSGSKKK